MENGEWNIFERGLLVGGICEKKNKKSIVVGRETGVEEGEDINDN
jgi:hypothetical protein